MDRIKQRGKREDYLSIFFLFLKLKHIIENKNKKGGQKKTKRKGKKPKKYEKKRKKKEKMARKKNLILFYY
jgi:hypothetical protein